MKTVEKQEKTSCGALAERLACREYRDFDSRDVLAAIADPKWDEAGSVGDWRNEVATEICAACPDSRVHFKPLVQKLKAGQFRLVLRLKRAKGFEPSTCSLGSYRSAN